MSLPGVIVPFVFVIIFYLAFIGNGIIAYKILRHRKMLNITNIYFLSLACANLLFIVTCLPFESQVFTLNFWPWGTFLCKLSSTTSRIFENVSIFTLIALSVERYTAIVKPIGILQSRSLTVCIVIIIWVVACILASSVAVYSNVTDNGFSPHCYTKIDFLETYEKVYATIQVVVSILLLFVSITYIFTNKKSFAAQSRNHDGQHLAGAVMICAIVFFICFAPKNVFWMLVYYKKEIIFNNDYYFFEKFWFPFIIIELCLRVFQSCTMPIILYCVGGYNFGYLYYRPSSQTGYAPDTEMVSVHLRGERL